MKKLISRLAAAMLAFAMILTLTACAPKGPTDSTKGFKQSFTAHVIEIYDKTAWVMAAADSSVRSSSDLFSISISDVRDGSGEVFSEETVDLKVGDEVLIYYSGYIMEIYPAVLDDYEVIYLSSAEE